MPPGWLYGQHDRGLYIVQTGQKEKREGDIRLWRLQGGRLYLIALVSSRRGRYIKLVAVYGIIDHYVDP